MYVDVNSVGNIFISRWASYELTVLANEPDAGMSRLCVVFLIFNFFNFAQCFSYEQG